MEKSLREYINIVESAQQEPTDEGLKSALAGAALAGSMAMNPAQANAPQPPTWQQQVRAAIQDGDLPPVRRIDRVVQQGGWVTAVIINGQTYDISHRSQDDPFRQAAQQLSARFAANEEVTEASPEALAQVDKLFKN